MTADDRCGLCLFDKKYGEEVRTMEQKREREEKKNERSEKEREKLGKKKKGRGRKEKRT